MQDPDNRDSQSDQPESNPDDGNPRDPDPRMMPPGNPLRRMFGFFFFVFLMCFMVLFSLAEDRKAHAETDLASIRERIRAGEVGSLEVFARELRVEGEFRGSNGTTNFRLAVPTEGLLDELCKDVDKWNRNNPDKQTRLVGGASASPIWIAVIQMLPWLLVGGVLIWFLVRQSRAMQGPPGAAFGRGASKVPVAELPRVTFGDVAGVQEAKAEVEEVIEFLREPGKFRKLGGRVPAGVLLCGPPGTGKTLLARAVAGEAKVPFFSISGSDFVEMFVGVGASRVRELFRQARENAPSIIFLDEIDAVGRRRGVSPNGGSEEREQTLNAILVEMDGFEGDSGVIVIAATNRPDVLDPALLRPGRFDREIVLDLPDRNGRKEILSVHSKNVPLDEDVDMEVIARGTPTFSGAELEALVNEAALIAALAEKEAVGVTDLEEARDKVRWGRARLSMELEEDERRTTAYHEAGHAILAELIPAAEPLHKVTIIPRGPSLGSTMQLPERDRHQMTLAQAQGTLMVLFGGRIAERIFCDDITSGASNDIMRATQIARHMVCEWGMSVRIGPVHYSGRGGDPQEGIQPLGEETRRKLDDEVRSIIDDAYAAAEVLIESHAAEVEAIAELLLERETLTGAEVSALMEEVRGRTGHEIETAS